MCYNSNCVFDMKNIRSAVRGVYRKTVCSFLYLSIIDIRIMQIKTELSENVESSFDKVLDNERFCIV